MERQPGRDLYAVVRRGLGAQGITLESWCEANGTSRQYVRMACLGLRNGPKAIRLRKKAVGAAKIDALAAFEGVPSGA